MGQAKYCSYFNAIARKKLVMDASVNHGYIETFFMFIFQCYVVRTKRKKSDTV